MQITSPAFANQQVIPQKYTCDGENSNPALHFLDVPHEAKSLVLLMEDPDVPKELKSDGMFDHWVVYNIDPTVKEIAENATPPGEQGLNSAGKHAYSAPCPPDREHRYFFKLYALDTMLSFDNPTQVTKQMVEEKMKGHILDQAELVGLYKRT